MRKKTVHRSHNFAVFITSQSDVYNAGTLGHYALVPMAFSWSIRRLDGEAVDYMNSNSTGTYLHRSLNGKSKASTM